MILIVEVFRLARKISHQDLHWVPIYKKGDVENRRKHVRQIKWYLKEDIGRPLRAQRDYYTPSVFHILKFVKYLNTSKYSAHSLVRTSQFFLFIESVRLAYRAVQLTCMGFFICIKLLLFVFTAIWLHYTNYNSC